jgi:hypothetical protein
MDITDYQSIAKAQKLKERRDDQPAAKEIWQTADGVKNNPVPKTAPSVALDRSL